MKLDLSKPILYLITRGATTEQTSRGSSEFSEILAQVAAAVTAGIDLIQIREKRLTARVLFELTRQAAMLTHGSATRLLVNDRADVARAAGADGVHLTTRSIDVATIRRTFGARFLIGVSTHSAVEAATAKNNGADFVVLGPVFDTASKLEYGSPLGLERVAQVTRELNEFPVFAIGGVTADNFSLCLKAGAIGIAGITLFSNPRQLKNLVSELLKVHSQ